ncbi:adenosylcobinamide-GDP ribazoletransferase [Novosphingobium sp. G106]|uniref:adenosylcobinamide-GDP ribazoletransferase n=1 Tax=Novosphingobium sp. G106 TaxID=2849500 RepID=UPI001C2D48B6|nr:adenosylcobinamide-GDP ribazoletransferase [Novosphingobium sp. G106]MBV1687453.1 adenosylcobinamide-GDP ribazoletransferase [Novosphingobium sp. G106]
MRGLVIAIQFLTRLPTPRVTADDAAFAASMRWFPAVGLIVGAIIAAGGWGGGLLDPWLGALAALVLWVAVTGALHLDGLADFADASGAAHKDRERLLAVLADPHIGSFGVVAIVLQLVAKAVLLHAAVERSLFVALLLIPFTARIGTLVWTKWLPSLHQGLAARFVSAVRPIDLAFWATVLLVAAWFVPALLIALPLFLWWGWQVRRTLGGISGDGHGAGIELIETALLLGAVITAHLA